MTHKEEENTMLSIAHPLAEDKLHRRVLRTLKRASKQKQVKRGVREVTKSLRKLPKKTLSKSILVLSADIYPQDVVSHLPVYCEEQGVGYVWVKGKKELGEALGGKRSTACVLMLPGEEEEYTQSLDACHQAISALE